MAGRRRWAEHIGMAYGLLLPDCQPNTLLDNGHYIIIVIIIIDNNNYQALSEVVPNESPPFPFLTKFNAVGYLKRCPVHPATIVYNTLPNPKC